MVDAANISQYSTTPALNLALNGISDAEGWLPSTVNNFTREWLAQLAKFYDDFGGVNTVAGTANAITITTPTVYTALATGMRIRFIAASSNTTAVTINTDALGAKAGRKIVGGTDVALGAGDLMAGVAYDAVYSTAANSAAGGWIVTPQAFGLPFTTVGDSNFGASPMTLAVRDLSNGTGWSLTNVHVGYDYQSDDSSGVGAGLLVRHGLRSANTNTHSAYEWVLQTAPVTAGTMVDAIKVSYQGVVTLPIGQLSFPAAQNASSDPNTIDDYEEQDTTPVPTSSTGSFTTVTSAISTTKIGNRVNVSGSLILSSAGTAAGELRVTLPFGNASGTRVAGGGMEVTGTNLGICCWMDSGSTTLRIYKYDGTTIIASSRIVAFSINYRVD